MTTNNKQACIWEPKKLSKGVTTASALAIVCSFTKTVYTVVSTKTIDKYIPAGWRVVRVTALIPRFVPSMRSAVNYMVPIRLGA